MRLLVIPIAILLMGTVSCAASIDFDSPPVIAYGEEICEECGMIISEARFAAAYVTTAGEVRRFDDAGGMIQQHIRVGEDVAVFWLHDLDTAEWVRAEDAFLLSTNDVLTPMGHGIVAFADEDRARAFSTLQAGLNGGIIGSWDDMVSAIRDERSTSNTIGAEGMLSN